MRYGLTSRTIRTEKISGNVLANRRPVLSELLKDLRKWDTLKVVKLDRLRRNVVDALSLIDMLHKKAISVRILNLGKPLRSLFQTLPAGFAEFEKVIIRERCIARLELARANGVHLRRKSSLTKHQRTHAQRLREEGKSVSEVARILNISRITAWRAMNRVQTVS